jgi:hypothetical protein
MKKPWNLILNQSNIKGWDWKKNFNYIKRLKKIAFKGMRIKIEKQDKFYIWLKGEIEKKNQFIKRTKNTQKNKDKNWHKK